MSLKNQTVDIAGLLEKCLNCVDLLLLFEIISNFFMTRYIHQYYRLFLKFQGIIIIVHFITSQSLSIVTLSITKLLKKGKYQLS